MNRLLLASVAAAPLLLATPVLAQTTISDARTTSVATSTAASGAASDVTVSTSGSIRPAAASGAAAITLDSNNAVINRGTLEYIGRNDTTGVLILGGRTGSVENSGSINLTEDFTGTDADNDGDRDGPFAQGSGRFGIRLLGPGGFTGNVSHLRGGVITVEGVASGGIVLEQALTGALRSAGTVSVTGNNSVGVSATEVSGDVSILGAVTATGENSTAVRLGEIGGRLVLQSAISATGYRSAARPADKAVRDKLDADDLLQGGPAVAITGDVVGGVLLDRPPTDASTTDTDEDDDLIPDAEEGIASISVAGAAPALDIGAAGDIRLGVLGTGANAYGLLNRGTINSTGVYDGINSVALRIGRLGGGATVIDGGVRLAGAGGVRADAFEADSTGVRFDAGAQTPVLRLDRGASISAVTASETVRTATAIAFEAGASVPLLQNAGEIVGAVNGEKGTAVAIADRSNSLARIENTGIIRAAIIPTDDGLDTDDTDNDATNEVVTGRAIAIDLRTNTLGSTFVQTGTADGDDGADNVADPDADGDGVDNADEPAITGDVLFGSGADSLELRNGTFRGALSFGAGADSLLIDGGADLRGALSDSDGLLTIDLRKGRLELTNADTLSLTSLSVAADGVLAVTLDPTRATQDTLDVSGAATLAAGAQVDVRLTSLLTAPASFRIIDAASLSAGTLDSTLAGTPLLYSASLRAVAADGDLFVDVRRKTSNELGFNASEADAYDAVFANLGRDSRIQSAILAQTDRDAFVGLYDQLLPDHSGGSIMSAAAIASAISGAINAHSGATGTPGANGVWVQQVFFNIEQDRDSALGYEADGYGFAAGIEEVSESDSAIGLNVAIAVSDYNDRDAAVGAE